ncbi:MAG: type VI secretion system tube protein Hcp [Gammaproteobacteria bacterium]|nr:type VI secretion system tube protein Hcp [Gammaproteobacteria bacterium]MCF6363377.1 type VI secretion system tube protein Hcp [Gammaproteobacteria bacterium]
MSFDMYMKIEGIPGESTDDAHADWMELLSYNQGLSQAVSGTSGTGGRTGGRADFQHFTITKAIDSGTPDLAIYCASGKHIPKIEIELCLATEDKHTFMKYVMEDVIISSVSQEANGNTEGNRPTELVTFAYGKFVWEYTPVDQMGAAGAASTRTWNLETNKQE